VAIVKEYEDKGGITKNEACRILMADHGGSRSTYWKGFEYLLSNNGDNLIESRIVPPNKQQTKLFPTESNKKMTEFQNKLDHVESILNLIEKNPSIGDCYFNDIKNKRITKFSKKFAIYFQQEADSIRKTNEEKYLDIYTLQARHDLLEKLPLFLYDYVQDPDNGLTNVKEECLKNCNPFIERCLKILQEDYSNSPFFSNTWANECKSNTHVWNGRGQIIPNIESEFLKIIGRYYFLISKELADKFKIDSCDEQKTISNFAMAFYPRKKIMRGFDPIKEQIVDSDDLYNYKWKTVSNLNTAELPISVPDDIPDAFDTLGNRLMHGFYDDDFNDPAGIVEYYLNWIISLKILSSVELEMITIIFIRGIVQKQIEKDRTDETTKRLPNSMFF
jgi:hypothetical protein